MATPFVLPLDQICTSLSALVPRLFFVPAKSSKLDDAFSKAAFIFYTALEFCVLFLRECTMLFLDSEGMPRLASVGQIL